MEAQSSPLSRRAQGSRWAGPLGHFRLHLSEVQPGQAGAQAKGRYIRCGCRTIFQKGMAWLRPRRGPAARAVVLGPGQQCRWRDTQQLWVADALQAGRRGLPLYCSRLKGRPSWAEMLTPPAKARALWVGPLTQSSVQGRGRALRPFPQSKQCPAPTTAFRKAVVWPQARLRRAWQRLCTMYAQREGRRQGACRPARVRQVNSFDPPLQGHAGVDSTALIGPGASPRGVHCAGSGRATPAQRTPAGWARAAL